MRCLTMKIFLHKKIPSCSLTETLSNLLTKEDILSAISLLTVNLLVPKETA